jgi:dihydroorotate dehydrogenase
LKNEPPTRKPMGLLWSLFAKPLIAIQDSEKAHRRAVKALVISDSFFLTRGLLKLTNRRAELPSERFGLSFSNPLGIAAGMDKDAAAVRGWANLGLGFVEIGGVTMEPQEGNPKPRMFRVNKLQALVNRMGFNNLGSLKVAERLAKAKAKGKWPNVPVAANIGKSEKTANDEAAADYSTTLGRLWPHVDLFIINVSSPNTPGLRELQEDAALEDVLKACFKVNREMAEKSDADEKPILVKISPDLSDDKITSVVDVARAAGCAGIVATNTTTTRPTSSDAKVKSQLEQSGGLSGRPLARRSSEVIRIIAEHTQGDFPIIGVGGISGVEDAWEKITNGACLLQIYSALIFQGPAVVRRIVKGLKRKLSDNGLSSLDQAVGLALSQ